MKLIKPQEIKPHIPLKYRNYAGVGPYFIPLFGKMYFGRIIKILNVLINTKIKFKKILDVGGGFGVFSLNFKLNFPKSEIFIVDKNLREEIKDFLTRDFKIKLNDYIKGDICSEVSFNDKTFDLICALDILKHVYDPSVAIDEIIRLLKNNGLLFISVPTEGKLLRIIRYLVSTFKNIEVNPHWHGLIKSEKEFFNLLKRKSKIRIISGHKYPFRYFPRIFSYDMFYLIQKIE